jgi:phosphoribosyl 1,2-cyclic phosphodiesterase
MAVRFSVLASGSSGNASLVQADGFGVLIDCGLGPQLLAARLAAVGACWQHVRAVLLTHTHGDHWKDRTLAQIRRHNVPVYCHAGHHDTLSAYSPAFGHLRKAGLIREYDPARPFHLAPGLSFRPFPLSHDSGPTFGFRLDGNPGLFGPGWSVGYVADLGCWPEELAQFLAGVDVLALEFNHDVGLERRSRRPPHLVARVLGDRGHLSNAQAAELLRAVLQRSGDRLPRHVVQLHLSRDCNRPTLAADAARRVLDGHAPGTPVHTACQDRVGPVLTLDTPTARKSAVRPRSPSVRTPLPPIIGLFPAG